MSDSIKKLDEMGLLGDRSYIENEWHDSLNNEKKGLFERIDDLISDEVKKLNGKAQVTTTTRQNSDGSFVSKTVDFKYVNDGLLNSLKEETKSEFLDAFDSFFKEDDAFVNNNNQQGTQIMSEIVW